MLFFNWPSVWAQEIVSIISFILFCIRFPSCPEKRQIWINRCGLTDQEVLPYAKLCSFHFEPTCFKSKLKRRLLNRNALPTIFVKNHVKKTIMPIKKNKGTCYNIFL